MLGACPSRNLFFSSLLGEDVQRVPVHRHGHTGVKLVLGDRAAQVQRIPVGSESIRRLKASLTRSTAVQGALQRCGIKVKRAILARRGRPHEAIVRVGAIAPRDYLIGRREEAKGYEAG